MCVEQHERDRFFIKLTRVVEKESKSTEIDSIQKVLT